MKARVALDVLTASGTQAETCHKYQISSSMFALWKATLLGRLFVLFLADEEHDAEAARVAELEGLVGQLTLELAVLKRPRRGGVGRDVRRVVSPRPTSTGSGGYADCSAAPGPGCTAHRGPPTDESKLRKAVKVVAGSWPN